MELTELIEPPVEEAEPMRRMAIAAAHEPSATAQGIAYSSLAIAHSDIVKACNAIRVKHSNNEAIEIIDEAMQQMECARRMLTGEPWML
jgi:hypothetical protein